MNPDFSEQERSIREEVDRSEREMEDLERELHAIENELEGLAEKGLRYEALARVCESMEELDAVGASYLFWDEIERPENTARHLQHVRSKIDDFGEEIARAEDRRAAVIDRIGDQNRILDCLHYDLRDALEREEVRKTEWVVEREEGDIGNNTRQSPGLQW